MSTKTAETFSPICTCYMFELYSTYHGFVVFRTNPTAEKLRKRADDPAGVLETSRDL